MPLRIVTGVNTSNGSNRIVISCIFSVDQGVWDI